MSEHDDLFRETYESANKLYHDLVSTFGLVCAKHIDNSEISERTQKAYASCFEQWQSGPNNKCQCSNCHRGTILVLLENIHWAVRVLEPPIDKMGETKARLYLTQGRMILSVIDMVKNNLNPIAAFGLKLLMKGDPD